MTEPAHSDWVRDVAWAPAVGLPGNLIASCSEVRGCARELWCAAGGRGNHCRVVVLETPQDKKVKIWTEDFKAGFRLSCEIPFDCKVWRLSWSVMGNVLAVSQADNKVTLWKEGLGGSWKQLAGVSEHDQGDGQAM